MRVLSATIALVCVATAVAGFVIWREDGPAEVKRRNAAPAVTGSVATDRGLALRATAARLQHLDGKLAELDSKMQAMETEPASGEDGEAIEVAETADADPAKNDPSRLSEVTLGEWMDRTVSAEPSNREWSSTAEGQLRQGLSKVQGVELDRIDCGRRFCRADFTTESDDVTVMESLLSLPAFANESFTVPGESGAMSVYFTAPGVKINTLRTEAWNEARSRGI